MWAHAGDAYTSRFGRKRWEEYLVGGFAWQDMMNLTVRFRESRSMDFSGVGVRVFAYRFFRHYTYKVIKQYQILKM